MNWWGRLGGLALLLLFVLFSCEEDLSSIGIRRPTSKFRVTYAEIDIPSSVILQDRLVTYNGAVASDGVQRFLVGQYQDGEFGSIRTEIFTQISPSIDNSLVTASAVLDSLVLQLKTDFYQYGSKSVSDQVIQIHELSDTIKQVPYYNTSKVAYKPEVIGEKIITIDPALFDQNLIDNSDNNSANNKSKNYRIVLGGNYAQELFETFRSDADVTNDFTKFTGKHKGLAIIPSTSDKILGIDPAISATSLAEGTKLVMYYTEAGVQKVINFVLFPFTDNPVIGFSSIESNRAGTVLQSLTEPFTDFLPVDNKRYVQSGAGIITKLDFTKFFDYMDTVANPILNSAELVFENESSDFPPPSRFQFRALNDQNKYKSFLRDSLVDGVVTPFFDSELFVAYQSAVVSNSIGSTMDIMGDQVSSDPYLVSAGATNSISAFVTNFFQVQYAQRKNEKRIKYCSLHPLESQFRKSVNRFVLKDNIKLKIYYTTPVVETIE